MYAWYGRIVALALLLTVALPAQAQDWPSRWVRVSFAPDAAGSCADILVRYFTENLGQLSGQRFIVENKPGALTTIATEQAKRAPTRTDTRCSSPPEIRPSRRLRICSRNCAMIPSTILLRSRPCFARPSFSPCRPKSPINSLGWDLSPGCLRAIKRTAPAFMVRQTSSRSR